MRLEPLTLPLLLAALAATPSGAQIAYLTGASGGTIDTSGRVCSDDNLYIHHDGTFEFGVAWDGAGVQAPYDGCFGEAFDLGPGTVECVSVWICQHGSYLGQSTDVYVWEGGVTGAPGNVLALVTDVVFENVPYWPDVARYDVEIPVEVASGVTAGSWGNWPGHYLGYFWLTDLDGHSDYSWTHVAEGLGYPPGWQHPSLEELWGREMSMGIGVHFTSNSTPAEGATWGMVKSLFAPGR